MQVRFRKYDEVQNKYTLVTYLEVKDYVPMYKLLKTMCDTQAQCSLEVNTEDVADTDGDTYKIQHVSLVVPIMSGEILPYIMVDIEDDWL